MGVKIGDFVSVGGNNSLGQQKKKKKKQKKNQNPNPKQHKKKKKNTTHQTAENVTLGRRQKPGDEDTRQENNSRRLRKRSQCAYQKSSPEIET